jgi:ribonuclease HI
MAEAAALALGVSIVQALQIPLCSFLSDSQQLVHFLHQENQQNPPQWRIKPFTQVFINAAATLQTQLFKINRSQNSTADTLAKQARTSMITFQNCNCIRPACGPICSLFQALLQVDLNSVTILAASCCG